MDCCEITRDHFDKPKALSHLADYLKKGPVITTRHLLAGIRSTEITGATLLDIGAGIGVLHHELIGSVVAQTTHVEISDALSNVAREEALRRGTEQAISFRIGDVVDLAEDLPSADIVALDRVICCYPSFRPLMAAAMSRSNRYLVASYPRHTWLSRTFWRLDNWHRQLKGSSFKLFVHSTVEIDQILERAGFNCIYSRDSPIWHNVVYEKFD